MREQLKLAKRKANSSTTVDTTLEEEAISVGLNGFAIAANPMTKNLLKEKNLREKSRQTIDEHL